MKKSAVAVAAICAAVILTACGARPGQDGNGARKISPEEAKEMMDNGGVTVVDVRSREEFDEGHIPEAVLVTNETIGSEAPEELPDKDAVLLIYCRSGRRSAQAAEKLSGLGYTNVYDFGGIIDWPYDTVKSK